MNKKMKIAGMVFILSVTTLYAADGLIGTENDPIVTKSYVDKLFSMQSGTANSELESRLEAQEQLIVQLSGQIAELENKSQGFEIVTVPAGSTIYGKQGSEMIIRSGQGLIVATTSGVQDVTDGADLLGGEPAPKNNLLIIPREDGRGIQAVKQMVVMVRGGYILG